MVKVILYGCNGRMGSVLTDLIKEQSEMEVVAGIDVFTAEREYPVFPSLKDCSIKADVMIDFSSPLSVHQYIPIAVTQHLPVVVATTGLKEAELNLLEKASSSIAIFRSANMSIGINLLQELLQSATKVLMDRFDIEIIEKHHHFKKDAPSGTALKISEVLAGGMDWNLGDVAVYDRHGMIGERKTREIGIQTVRAGDIIGDHTVLFGGPGERIEITHRAHTRDTFALGALRAAEWVVKQPPGLYTMADVLGL